jgi:hypothetical protein
MKSVRLLCRLLVVSLLFFSFHSARAGMIGTDQIASTQADRVAVQAALNRADVATQLKALGVDPVAAKERVSVMTDDEVRSLAGQLDTLPAGAMADAWWWVIAAVVIAVAFYAWQRR